MIMFITMLSLTLIMTKSLKLALSNIILLEIQTALCYGVLSFNTNMLLPTWTATFFTLLVFATMSGMTLTIITCLSRYTGKEKINSNLSTSLW